jgi:hypothetical protein
MTDSYIGVPPQSGFITTAKQRVTSSTNNYVDLDHSISSLADVIVWVNFVKQDSTNLTLTTSSRITLGATLVASDIVEIAYLGKAVATQTPDTGTVTADALAGSIGLDKLSATGTKSSSTFLRGDNTFATVNGFDVSSITGATALTTQPASTDEIVLSDAGTLKRLDIKHIQSTPAFQGTMGSDITVTHNTWTKVPIDTEDFDTDGTYDHSTNYRWTPAVAGKYFIYGQCQADQNLTSYKWEGSHLRIYKNGSGVGAEQFIDLRQGGADSGSLNICFVVDLDADDYVELFAKARSLNDEQCRFNDSSSVFGGFRITGI